MDDIVDLALAAFRRGEIERAEAICLDLLERVRHPSALHVLALIRSQQNRPAEAIGLLEDAERIGGELAENCLHRAVILTRLAKDDPVRTPNAITDAEALFNRAMALDPGHAAARGEFAKFLIRSNRFDDAAALLRPLLGSRPVPGPILAAYAGVAAKIGEIDRAIEMLETALRGDRLSSSEQTECLAALADLFDRQGRYDEAFGAMRRSNELQYRGVAAPNFRHWVDAMKRTFDAHAVAGLPRAETTSKVPIYVVGMPRSGTSLVEQILATHSWVSGGGEFKVIGRVIDRVRRAGSDLGYPAAIPHLSRSEVDALGRTTIGEFESLLAGRRRVTNKQPTNFMHLGLIGMINPGARVVNCRRDPLDNCVSLFFQTWDVPAFYIKTLESLAEFSAGYDEIMSHWHQVLDLEILDVQYESLIEHPRKVVGEILEFLEMPWEDECLLFHQNERLVHTASHDQVRQPIYRRSVGRWRNYARHLRPLQMALEQHTARTGTYTV